MTNTSAQPIKILSVALKSPSTEGDFSIHNVRGTEQYYPRDFGIPADGTVVVSGNFIVRKQAVNPGDTFQTAIIFTDQFGRRHFHSKTEFASIGGLPKRPEPNLKVDIVSQLKSELEKNVAAILKDELQHYSLRGRLVGAMGTVQLKRDNVTRDGVGNLTPGTLAIRSIPNSVSSPNTDALVRLFNSLTSDSEKREFEDALLSRLTKDREYHKVGYLILLVLHRIGRLPAGLKKALIDLKGDSEHGFGNAIWLVDGLLSNEFGTFTTSQLDAIEQQILDEKLEFDIAKRIHAVRAWILRSQMGSGER